MDKKCFICGENLNDAGKRSVIKKNVCTFYYFYKCSNDSYFEQWTDERLDFVEYLMPQNCNYYHKINYGKNIMFLFSMVPNLMIAKDVAKSKEKAKVWAEKQLKYINFQ